MMESSLASKHLELINNLSKLTLASFEKEVNTRVVLASSKADDIVATETSSPAFKSNANTLVDMSKLLL
jgi:hypothetical protein